MKDINFIKNIDNLGRIVIPMDIRRKLQINTGDVLSITC
ncbi:MAG TPA: AbrB family transcriptional regulator, partial [Firmicutes bacterium]|nr:AbrB family transcriptional regulator [Bacillota bacterium]